MIKRFLMAAPVVALVVGSSFAMAAETVTVQLRADIPSSDFFVRPVAGVDLSKVQNMNWNVASSKLDSLKIDLDMKNTTRGINAKLDLAPELFSGADKIPLQIKVAGTTLSTTSTLVAAAERVRAGTRDALIIEPVTTTPRPEAGVYTGTVSVIFEPAA